jgi:hypothetical protein
MLDPNKSYPEAVYAILTKSDRDYLTTLREQKDQTPQRGGGGGKNIWTPITYKHNKNTKSGTRKGVDKDGKSTGQTEFYCSECGFWTKAHGDSHPTRKHDPNFRTKFQAKLNKKNDNTDTGTNSDSAGVSTLATSHQTPTTKQVTFLNQDNMSQETNFNSPGLFGFMHILDKE